MKPLVIITLLAGVASGGCADEATTVHDGHAPAAAPTKIVQGRRWILPGARTDAGDLVAVGARAVFRDLDGDDLLDADAEPSTPCVRADGAWRCDLALRQITVLRRSTAAGETLYVIPRWLTGTPQRYCVGDASGCATPFRPMPVRASDARSVCAPQPVLWLEGAAPLHLDLGPGPRVDQRPRLHRNDDGSVTLTITGSQPTRVRATLGPAAAPRWDSETSVEEWRTTLGQLAITVPAAALAACPTCSVEVAFAVHAQWRAAPIDATVVDVHERVYQLELPPNET